MKPSLSAFEIIDEVADPESFVAGECRPGVDDPLRFVSREPYADRLNAARQGTGLTCGLTWGRAQIGGRKAVVIANDLRFFLGSLGTAEIETLALALETAAQERLPAVWLARGSGTRLEEGAVALMALRRIFVARNRMARQGVPLVTVALDPLFGGSAMCALQGDVLLACEDARIGFAGVGVVRMFEKDTLPHEFQTAPYALRSGQVDAVVPWSEAKACLHDVLDLLTVDAEAPVESLISAISGGLGAPATRSAWETVLASRSPDKPSLAQLLSHLAESLFELRGDRVTGDDPALFGGFARIGGRRVMVIGHRASHVPDERVRQNLSAPHPAGHRKALRLLRLAERLRLPVVTFIDTPGAYADVRSEAEGQAHILGELASAFACAGVPVISVLHGEGVGAAALALCGSGGLLITDAGWLAPIPPEGAAAILWKDPREAARAAEAMRIATEPGGTAIR